MKVFTNALNKFITGGPVTPENYNTNMSAMADANNDIASKRYTRWSTVYQYGGYNNTFASETLKFKVPAAYSTTSGINLNQTTFNAAGVLTAGSYSDIKFINNGFSIMLLGLVGGVTTFVTYNLAVGYDLTTIINTPTTTTISATDFVNLKGFCFNTDGTRLFGIVQAVPSIVRQFNLTVPWDPSSAVLLTSVANLVSASNNLNYISFNSDLIESITGRELYYGAKGGTSFITRALSTAFTLSTAGVESTITPVPNDLLYGVHVVRDGAGSSATKTGLSLAYFAGPQVTYLRRHSNNALTATSALFAIGNYRNIKAYNNFVANAFTVSRLGTDVLHMTTNGFIHNYILKNRYLEQPIVSTERIIVAGYYTAASPITLTFTGNGLSDSYNITLPASTDALERRFAFDGKKINMSVGSYTDAPTLNIASAGIFNISKLDVELHFVSDRLATNISKTIQINANDVLPGTVLDLNTNDYINENESVDAVKVNSTSTTISRINKDNLDRDSSFRWTHYCALGVSSAASHIFEIPTARNYLLTSNNSNSQIVSFNSTQVITGYYLVVSTMAGGVMSIADTITITSGAVNNFKQTVNLTATNNQIIPFQPTISGGLITPYYGSGEQVSNFAVVPGAAWDTRFFTLSTTSATALKVQVYIMYA